MRKERAWLHGNTKPLYRTWLQFLTRFTMAKPPELCPVETTARIVGGRWKPPLSSNFSKARSGSPNLSVLLPVSRNERSPSNSAICNQRESSSVRCWRFPSGLRITQNQSFVSHNAVCDGYSLGETGTKTRAGHTCVVPEASILLGTPKP
jgi:hypothetical protein